LFADGKLAVVQQSIINADVFSLARGPWHHFGQKRGIIIGYNWHKIKVGQFYSFLLSSDIIQ